MALHVEDELVAGQCLACGVWVSAGPLFDREGPAGLLVARIVEAALKGEQSGRCRGDREHEVAPRKPEALRVPLARLVRPLDRLALDGRQGGGDVLPVRARAELDRKAGIVLGWRGHAWLTLIRFGPESRSGSGVN